MELLAELDVNSVAAAKSGKGPVGVGATGAAGGGGSQTAAVVVVSAGGSGEGDAEDEVRSLGFCALV